LGNFPDEMPGVLWRQEASLEKMRRRGLTVDGCRCIPGLRGRAPGGNPGTREIRVESAVNTILRLKRL